MVFLLGEWILLISFSIIYFVFLFYDLFNRGDNYGALAYIMALLPANYLWYIVAKNDLQSFGLTGCMLVLAGMWQLAVLRDIYIKDRAQGYKDADDVALMLVIGIIINLILSAVLPAFKSISYMADYAEVQLKWFHFPILDPTGGPNATIILAYKIVVTTVTLSTIIPTVLDLRDTPTNIVALIVITVIYAIPFAFLAFIWAPTSGLIWVLLVLFSVLFFTFLLMITRGMEQRY